VDTETKDVSDQGRPIGHIRRVPPKAAVAVAIVLVVGVIVWLSGDWGQKTFPMKELPTPEIAMAFDMYDTPAGEPSPLVRKYPQFVSAKPLFGSFFTDIADHEERPDAGRPYAVDESKGTGTGYDTLYLDANYNLDLTDDKPVKGVQSSTEDYRTCFDEIAVHDGEGGAEVVVAPRLEEASRVFWLVGFPPRYIREGTVRIGGRECTVTLMGGKSGSGGFDEPSTLMRVVVAASDARIGQTVLWHRYDQSGIQVTLGTRFQLGDEWYSLSATPDGNQVTVHRYRGDFGVVRVSHNGKTAGNVVRGGLLRGRDGMNALLPQGEPSGAAPYEGELCVPAGDYVPENIGVSVGVPYLFARWRPTGEDGVTYADRDYFLKVRKGAPCTLDVESSAEILWGQSDGDKAYTAGDTISVWPRLATKTLMIQAVIQSPPLAKFYPTILIQDSTGKTIKQDPVKAAYRWHVPFGLAPNGKRGMLKMTVKWDTAGLFGVVTSTKDIVVESTQAAVSK